MINKTNKIWNLFLSGEILTVKRAWVIAGTTELRKYRCRLEKQYGVKINSRKRPGELYFEYWLSPESMQSLKNPQ